MKVSLVGIRPEIWRRLLVPEDVTLEKLHKVLQQVMGWQNYHLYGFEIDHIRYGESSMNGFGLAVRSTKRALLASLIDLGARFTYTYDFGDEWVHRIAVEKVIDAEPGTKYPVCLGGKRACPPEDCGGSYGYRELLEALRDPEHDEHEDNLEWVGEDFDAESFDTEKVNALLVKARLARALR